MKLVLKPHETMKDRRAQEQLALDADNIHRVIRNQPGIPGKAAIAAQTGLSPDRVTHVMKRINRGETGHTRVEYGEIKARGGPYAGELVRGWYAMNLKRHHVALDQADEHSAVTEIGVRRSRLIRFAQAQGIRGAEEVVDSIAERLGLSIDAMSEADIAAFEDLLLEAAPDGEEAA
jgi:hypothetical protein